MSQTTEQDTFATDPAQMTSTEAVMWRLDSDPQLSSAFATVMVLDRSPDYEALRRRMHRAAMVVPRLRQRVHEVIGNLAPPLWVDDPDFDIDNHLATTVCPAPGTLRQVLDLATRLLAEPFDRSRPLWQFLVVEDMADGRAALIQKMHHTLNDGERGVEVSLAYLDFDRDAPPPPDVPEPIAPVPEPDSSQIAIDIATNTMRLPLAVAQRVRDLATDPQSIPTATNSASKTLTAITKTLADSPARSPLWTARSMGRRVETARAPFRATKDRAKELGGTLNTAFVAAAAHAAANYHLALGAEVDTLRTSMAVSTRTESSGNNAFSIVKLTVPATPMPIRERFAAVLAAVETAKQSTGGAKLDTLAALGAVLPTSVMTKMARQQGQTIDFATSNVKGSPVPVYLSGSQVLEIYPIGPTGNVAFNLTLMSYLGSLDMALNIDTAAVAEPGLLTDLMVAAYNEFLTD